MVKEYHLYRLEYSQMQFPWIICLISIQKIQQALSLPLWIWANTKLSFTVFISNFYFWHIFLTLFIVFSPTSSTLIVGFLSETISHQGTKLWTFSELWFLRGWGAGMEQSASPSPAQEFRSVPTSQHMTHLTSTTLQTAAHHGTSRLLKNSWGCKW
jgi:hypothetical protein